MPPLAPAAHEIEFVQEGRFTIPPSVQESYHLEPGQKGTLIELHGAILILPRPSQTPVLFDQLRDGLGTGEMSLEEMIAEMREIRESADYEAPA